MRQRKLFIGTIVVILISTIVSCSTTPPVRIFVVEGGQQYFVRPTTVTSKELSMAMDFTIRKTEAVQNVTMNVTFDNLTDVESIRLDIGDKEAFEVTAFSLVFSKLDARRWTGTVAFSDFKNLTEQVRVQDGDIVITVTFVDGQEHTLTKTNKLREKLSAVPPL